LPDIQISEKLLLLIYFMPIFLLSLSIHEYAHALLAYKYGDDTAKNQGRLTLNPLKHIDLVGSIVMPILAFTSGFMLIGWAKPVPVDRRNFKNVLKDDAIVSFAGPLSNLIFAIIIYVTYLVLDSSDLIQSNFVYNIFRLGVIFNVFLFCFNLLPIPPLDGSHIIYDLFPNAYTAKLQNMGMYGTLILFLFIYSPMWSMFMNIVNWIVGFFPI